MTGTILSSYLAFLLQSGTPVPTAQAHVATTTPTRARPAIVVDSETRNATPRAVNENLGAGVLVSDVADTAVASTADAITVVDSVQKFYAGIKQVTAQFRQYVSNATFGTNKKTDGKVWIKKPGKMRWDYYSPKTASKKAQTIKTFISNGTYLYVVDHQNKQVIEKNLEKNMLPVAVTFLYGKGDLKKDFDATLDTSGTYGSKTDGDIVLMLTPKTTSTQYKTLYLVVAKDDFRVRESVIVDGAGNVNHFAFYAPDFDTEVADKQFVFNKKSVKDYRITSDDDDSDDTSSKDSGKGE